MTALDDPREVSVDVAATADVEPAGSWLPGRTPRDVWRAARAPVAIAAFVLLVAVVVAAFSESQRGGLLDPEAARPTGGRALAELLRDRGVDVERRPTYSQAAGRRTIFVPLPELLGEDDLSEVGGSSHDLVIVAPDGEQLTALGIAEVDARPMEMFDQAVVPPLCDLREARTAGRVELGGIGYDTGSADEACYSRQGAPTLLVYDLDDRRVVIVGSPDLFTNDRLDEQGNAALALGLLSRHDDVEWLRPRTNELLGADADRTTSLDDLLPRRVTSLQLELVVAFVLLALWRARRLGPVVAEPMPVVVRAAETVEGRGRLYQSAHARDQAASALRSATHDRLVRLLGLAPDARPGTVVAAVAERTGAPPASVGTLLYGPPPADDAGLVRLAADLDTLDSEVRRP